MAKVKSSLFNALQNPLREHSLDHASVSAVSCAFYTHGDTIVMRTKPKSPPHTSDVHLAQQERWKDADCMWKAMTPGQRTLWNNYYVQEYKAGRTLYTESTKAMQHAGGIPPHDMGQRTLFFSHALRLDLLDYLQNFLLSEWLIVAVTEQARTWLITAGLTNPPELNEATIFQEPKPVRGFH